MLELDSPEWRALKHAYGSAKDTPALLNRLKAFPADDGKAEPWLTLWGSLAHQGDVYPASFAAVPHVVDALSKDPSKAHASYFHFPAWVEICRAKNKVKVPANLKAEYERALGRLPGLVAAAANKPWDESFGRCALAAVAAAKGAHAMAEAILELSPDMLGEFEQWLNGQ